MAQIRCYFMSDFYGCVLWVGFCVFIIYHPFTEKNLQLHGCRISCSYEKALGFQKCFSAIKVVNTGCVVLVSSYSYCIHNMIVRDFCTDNKSRFDDITH